MILAATIALLCLSAFLVDRAPFLAGVVSNIPVKTIGFLFMLNAAGWSAEGVKGAFIASWINTVILWVLLLRA